MGCNGWPLILISRTNEENWWEQRKSRPRHVDAASCRLVTATEPEDYSSGDTKIVLVIIHSVVEAC